MVSIVALRSREGVVRCVGVGGAEMIELLGLLGGEVAGRVVPVGLGRRGEGSRESGLSGRHGRGWRGARMASGLWFTLTRLLARVSAVILGLDPGQEHLSHHRGLDNTHCVPGDSGDLLPTCRCERRDRVAVEKPPSRETRCSWVTGRQLEG